MTNKRNLSATESIRAYGMWAPPCHPPEECRFIPLGRSTPVIDVVLHHKLRTTMHAILVPVHPALRMFVVAAFLGGNVHVYRFPTHNSGSAGLGRQGARDSCFDTIPVAFSLSPIELTHQNACMAP